MPTKISKLFANGRYLLLIYGILICILVVSIFIIKRDAAISVQGYREVSTLDAAKETIVARLRKNNAAIQLKLMQVILHEKILNVELEHSMMSVLRHENDSLIASYKNLITDTIEARYFLNAIAAREKNSAAREKLIHIINHDSPQSAMNYLKSVQYFRFANYQQQLDILFEYIQTQTSAGLTRIDNYVRHAVVRLFLLMGSGIFILILFILLIIRTVKKMQADNIMLADRSKLISDYKDALDQSSVVSITAADGIISYVNDRFCKESGYAREELIGKNHRVLNSGYHPKEFFTGMWNTISSGKIWHGEIRNKTKSGHYFWTDSTIVPFLNGDGKPYQYVAIRNNITKLKQTSNALEEKVNVLESLNDKLELLANRFDRTQEIAGMGYWEVNLATFKSNWSDESFRIYDLEPGSIEPSYEMFLKFVHPEDYERVKAITEKSMQTFHPFAFRYRVSLANGKVKHVYATGHYEFNKEGQPTHLFGTSQDITELMKTNSELNRFVYSVSHDLRAPLLSILGLANLINDDEDFKKIELREKVDMIKKSIKRLDTFISDILDYSRNGRLEVSRDEINFKKLVNETRENLKFMEGTDGYNLQLYIHQPAKFISDKGRIGIVLNNIISNAIKYQDTNKANPFVNIRIESDEEKAVLTIEDNGIGIEEKNQAKIFDMFYRVSKLSNGSGLGLYIVKETIEKLQGTIKLESQLAKGSKFIITLPNLN
jgi:PAS domain S-box-containing protein